MNQITEIIHYQYQNKEISTPTSEGYLTDFHRTKDWIEWLKKEFEISKEDWKEKQWKIQFKSKNQPQYDKLFYTIDINPKVPADQHWDFLKDESQIFKLVQIWGYSYQCLILCNPPFNGYGNKLGSEVWLDKIIELFGKDVPIVLFAPLGLRLHSKGSEYFQQKYPSISSIISLPHDIFPQVKYTLEILIFNIKGLEAHYFFTYVQ